MEADPPSPGWGFRGVFPPPPPVPSKRRRSHNAWKALFFGILFRGKEIPAARAESLRSAALIRVVFLAETAFRGSFGRARLLLLSAAIFNCWEARPRIWGGGDWADPRPD